jgi:hypothetical protein
MGTLSLFTLGTGSRIITNSRQFILYTMREACKFNLRIHNGNILMSSVTKDPGVSSILLFSGSGINFPRPLYSLSLNQYFPRLPSAISGGSDNRKFLLSVDWPSYFFLAQFSKTNPINKVVTTVLPIPVSSGCKKFY